MANESETKKWRDSAIAILSKIVANVTDHNKFLLSQIRNGASCFSIIQSLPRMERSVPFMLCPISDDAKNSKLDRMETIVWIIKYMSQRTGRIWSDLGEYHVGNEIMCRRPTATHQCELDGCLGKLASWFGADKTDATQCCNISCLTETLIESKNGTKKRPNDASESDGTPPNESKIKKEASV
jgi:hypothetical protein